MGTPLEEDLGSWGHHFFSTSVPDAIFQASAGDEVGQQLKVLYLIRIFSRGLLIYKICRDLISVWVPLDCKYRAANA